MARVHVERRECKGCGLYAWASDNWRTTGLFNYNNSYLVEVSILYDCLKAFSKGVHITSFFEMFLEPLDGSLEWGDANPELASRYGAVKRLEEVRLHVVLKEACRVGHRPQGWLDTYEVRGGVSRRIARMVLVSIFVLSRLPELFRADTYIV